jgi:hypothetical protein
MTIFIALAHFLGNPSNRHLSVFVVAYTGGEEECTCLAEFTHACGHK